MKAVKNILSWVIPILVGFLIAAVIKTFFVSVVKVDGTSMYPNLQNNERVLMLHKAKIKRDSVVVFDAYGVDRNNTSLTKDTKYVKRVIALPGDTVEYRDNGQLFVNGKFRSQGYITSQQQVDGTLKTAANLPKAKGVVLGTGSTFKVPKGKYFVLGDNRSVSNDSRSIHIKEPTEKCPHAKEHAVFILQKFSAKSKKALGRAFEHYFI